MTVRKAVIPAAGLGTRMLPATKSQPKEMIPIVDKPGIQYVVEEAVRAGIEDILIITSRNKGTLEDHFDRSLELEYQLERTGKTEYLEMVRRIPDLADFHYVRQKEPLGFGHAVLTARNHVGDDPFVVMVPDEIVPEPLEGETSLVGRMIERYGREQARVIAVQEVPREQTSSYGIVDVDEVRDGFALLRDMVEKPPVEEAPSNLAARGRYVFSASIFDAIEKTSAGVGGEIQLTDAIRLLAKEASVYAYVHEGPILDVGRTVEYVTATIELALARNDLAPQLKEYLRRLAPKLN